MMARGAPLTASNVLRMIAVTALGQHLNGDVVRDAVAIDQGAQEVVLGSGRCREADLNA